MCSFKYMYVLLVKVTLTTSYYICSYLQINSSITIPVPVRRAKLGQIQGGLQRASQDSTKGGLQ